MTITTNDLDAANADEGDQLLTEQEQQWVDKFMDETTLFLGPDPAIMRTHEIMPRTAYEEECIAQGIDPGIDRGHDRGIDVDIGRHRGGHRRLAPGGWWGPCPRRAAGGVTCP